MNKSFHQLSANDSLEQLKATTEGLSAGEVQIRLAQYGPNELEQQQKKSPWLLLLHQFTDFMIIVLMAAAVISGLIGDPVDSVIILVIVLLNAILGFVQEYRAEKAMEALRKMAVLNAKVIRNNTTQQIPSSELVPGDIVLLEAGNAVPADMRLLEAHSLRIDESALTGESVAVDKGTDTIADAEALLGDRVNMAYKSTLITNGRGIGLVTSTGMQTEIGKIALLLQGKESETPLKQRMAAFGKKLSYIILFICLVLFAVGLLRGEDWMKMMLLSISLAVAAIPEALPALITIALSRGAARMVKQQALIRKLPAVETLGSVSFICTDKTGTLTLNKMKVVQHYALPGLPPVVENNQLHLCMALNHDVQMSDAENWVGDPTEIALVEHVVQAEGNNALTALQQHYPRIAELPFDSDRKCMTTIHQVDQRLLVVSKGAVESISAIAAPGEPVELLNAEAELWATKGLRVLAYAIKWLDALPTPFHYEQVEQNMQLVGLAGLIDPPREEVKAAISECKKAGIKPVMITGDHPATAKAIATEIGIMEPKDLMFTGKELQKIGFEDFLEKVEKTAVYARVSPEQKLMIVKALQQRQHFAAMTGDGVNDAPSLKAANIGVAMGINGTDVSKEAAHMILLDDNFATIIKAVKEGRRIFDNIRKFVKYIMTCNSAEIWTIFLAPLLALPMPLLPIHILWINLVTDGLPGLALASEKAESDVMHRPPRPSNESLFAGGLGYHILWVGILMAGVTLATQAYCIKTNSAHWQTMVFTVLSLSQLGHALAIRSERTFLYRQGLFSNPALLGSVLFTFGLQLMVIYLPVMNGLFKTEPLSISELAICIGLSAIVFHAVELEKWIKSSRTFKKA
jgi:Ca2+-transporting ATPase